SAESLERSDPAGAESPSFERRAVRGPLALWAPPKQRRGPAPASKAPGPMARAQGPEGRRLLAEFDRSRNLGLCIAGLPGTGKSTLLLHLILDDIRAGRACCVIDPHGDLVTQVMERCPTDPATLARILRFDP